MKPGTLVAYDIKAVDIVDLTDLKTVEACEVTEDELKCNWLNIVEIEKKTPPTWRLGDYLLTRGYNGVLAHSIPGYPGVNLVWWHPQHANGVTVVPHDRHHDLPKNQRSWQ